MKNELWRDIPGHEGRFQASNLGRVKSLRKVVLFRTREGKVRKRLVRERIFKVDREPNDAGYGVVKLDGINRYVHWCIATAFLGPRPSDDHVVNHKDFDKRNNRVENLEWITAYENVIHALPARLECRKDPRQLSFRFG